MVTLQELLHLVTLDANWCICILKCGDFQQNGVEIDDFWCNKVTNPKEDLRRNFLV